MKLLNRNAVVIKPKPPYRDWIARLDGDDPADAAFATAWEQGRAMSLEQTIEYALA